jgi:catechol 2,3-dioxygenase-like lactoylglutathione lyase family enzyme
MTVRHLDHLNLTITSWDATVEWYHRVFGFDVVESGVRQGQRWGVLRAGDALLCVYESPERHVLDDDEATRFRAHTLNHFSLRLTDRAVWEATLAREGLPFSYPSPVDWTHSTAWYVLDPSGHEIEVTVWDDDTVSFAGANIQ